MKTQRAADQPNDRTAAHLPAHLSVLPVASVPFAMNPAMYPDTNTVQPQRPDVLMHWLPANTAARRTESFHSAALLARLA